MRDFDFSEAAVAHLAEIVAARVVAQIGASQNPPDRWLDSTDAAAYLGMTRNALHKLTQRQAIPFCQDAPNSKLYFRVADLDHWRLKRSHGIR